MQQTEHHLPADLVERDAAAQVQGPQPIDLRLWTLIGGGTTEPLPAVNGYELPKGGW